MDSPIDPVNKGTEYVGLPKVDPWHESEKHKKKRFAKMLEDQLEDKKTKADEDAVELSGHEAEDDESSESAPETPAKKPADALAEDEAPQPPDAHIDLKG